jgi:hypothetical protein
MLSPSVAQLQHFRYITRRCTSDNGYGCGRELRPPFGRSKDALTLLLSEQPGKEIPSRSEALFGRNRSGLGIGDPHFRLIQLSPKLLDGLLRFG